jgi:hypothetical protein
MGRRWLATVFRSARAIRRRSGSSRCNTRTSGRCRRLNQIACEQAEVMPAAEPSVLEPPPPAESTLPASQGSLGYSALLMGRRGIAAHLSRLGRSSSVAVAAIGNLCRYRGGWGRLGLAHRQSVLLAVAHNCVDGALPQVLKLNAPRWRKRPPVFALWDGQLAICAADTSVCRDTRIANFAAELCGGGEW